MLRFFVTFFKSHARGETVGGIKQAADPNPIPTKLIFFDLLDGSHGALFHAVATGDAGVFVYDHRCIAHDIQNTLRAGIHTDTTGRTFICVYYRTGHYKLLSVAVATTISSLGQQHNQIFNVSVRTEYI
jgi:hypothetical protein